MAFTVTVTVTVTFTVTVIITVTFTVIVTVSITITDRYCDHHCNRDRYCDLHCDCYFNYSENVKLVIAFIYRTVTGYIRSHCSRVNYRFVDLQSIL